MVPAAVSEVPMFTHVVDDRVGNACSTTVPTKVPDTSTETLAFIIPIGPTEAPGDVKVPLVEAIICDMGDSDQLFGKPGK
jgi:hypothetical protein